MFPQAFFIFITRLVPKEAKSEQQDLEIKKSSLKRSQEDFQVNVCNTACKLIYSQRRKS